MGTPLFPDEGFKINVEIATRLKARVEGRTLLVGFEGTHNDVSDRTVLPLCQTTGEVSRLRASD